MLKRLSFFKSLFLTLSFICFFGNASAIASSINSLPELQNATVLNQQTKKLLEANNLTKNGRDNADLVKTKAKKRLTSLLEIIDSNPSAVLRVAFSNKISATMAPSAKKYIEEEVRGLAGTFIVMGELGKDSSSHIHYYLKTKDGKQYTLHFIHEPQKLPVTGTSVSIPYAIKIPAFSGDNHLIIPDDLKNPVIKVVELLPAYPATGLFKVLAILVNFQDAPTNQPWTPDAVKNTIQQNVSGFFYENSSHLTSLSVDTAGWFTTTFNSTDNCDTISNSLLTSAKSMALAAGKNPANYDRVEVIFPKLSNCGWAGLGYIGGGPTWGITWINGYVTQQVIGHELGHNFGLYHSHSQTCSSGPIGGTCTTSEYGDSADTMGNKTASHFAAAQKESLGWLDYASVPPITTALTSGIYKIEPYETYSFGVKAIRVPKVTPTTTSEYYYVEYRQPIGYDAQLAGRGNLTQGVLIRRGIRGGTGGGSYLLNMVQTDTSFNSAALTPGNTFSDPSAPNNGVNITLVSADTTGATIAVNYGATPVCTRANPTLTVSPNTTTWVHPGESASYVLTLKNNDSSTCANSTFNLNAPAVSGVTSTLPTASPSIAPGASGTVNLQIQSSTSTSDGVYSVVVNAVNSASASSTASVTASLGVQQACVRANPTISLTPSSQTGPAGGNVSYVLNVKNNDNATCGISTFNLSSTTVSSIAGTLDKTTLSLAPGASDSANLKVSSQATTAAGTYNVTANAINAGAITYNANASAAYVVTSTCTVAAPTISISPSTQTTSGNPVNYTVSVTNNNSSGCGTGIVGLSANTSSYYLKTFMEPYNVIVDPGKTASSVLTLTPGDGLIGGTYSATITGVVSGTTAGGSATTALVYTPPAPCVRANPTVTVAPQSQSGPIGSSASFVYNVKNNDSATCPVTSFNLTSVLPTGFTGTFSQAALSLSPGANANSTLLVTSPSSALAGTYNIVGNAVNAGMGAYTGSATAAFVLNAVQALTVNITTDQSVYQRTSTLYYAKITVAATLAGAGAPNLPLVVTLTYPNGTSDSISTTTGSSGSRAFLQDIQMSSQVGTYKLSATVTYQGNAVLGSGSFIVQ
ncbi:MAG: NEW3 domain-containing protein [Gammaproteobacteria bacterium]|nr:NEW3 domain-containing protein [Gammaproteobacteria bacterium]